MIDRYSDWLIRNRWWAIASSLLLFILLSAGAKNLTFRSDYRVFFSEDNPQLQAYDLIQATYAKNDNIIILLKPQSGDAFDQDTLSAVQALTDEAWQLPYVSRVDSLYNYQHTRVEGDDLFVDDLLDGFPDLSAQQITTIKEIALNEPLIQHRLISTDGAVTAVNLTLYFPEESDLEMPEAVAATRALIEKVKSAHPNIDFYTTGSVLLNNAFYESSTKDAKTLIPLTFLVIIVTLGVLLRSFSATIGSMIVIVASITIAMGTYGWLGFYLSGPVTSAPTIIVTIAVADCVHLLTTFLHEMRLGQNKQDAMRTSLRINFQPIFITTLTTVIGFLSMNTSEVPPFRDLGNIVAFGVISAWFFAIFTLPALMMVLPVGVKARESTHKESLTGLSEFIIRNQRSLFWSILLGSIVLIGLASKNEINDEFISNFDHSIQFRVHTDAIEKNLTGIYTLDYSIHSDGEGGISDPQFLQDLDKFKNWLLTKPEVVHVNTISDIFKRLNRNMHGDDPAWYRIPENRQLASQYLLLYEMSLPYGLDLTNQINLDKSATRVTIALKNISSSRSLTLEDEVDAWLSANTQFKQFYEASPNSMFAHIGYRNAESMISGTLIAMSLITLILVFALRSLKLGLMSLIPNLLPITIAFGIWGIIDGNIGISLATSIGMALGIVVDDTVHFLSKYLRAKRERNLSDEDAVRYAFSTVGVALWVTSFVLVAGFFILSLSSFGMNSNRGLFASITIALALLIDFLFLPTLLMKKTNPEKQIQG